MDGHLKAPPLSRVCCKCNLLLDAKYFRVIKRRTYYALYSYCIECTNRHHRETYFKAPEGQLARCKAWQSRNPARIYAYQRKHHLKKKYGISVEDYNRTLLQQGGGCAVCGAMATDSLGRKLSVDHNHATGKARGLLCSRCNRAVADLREDRKIAKRMVEYLTKYS